MLVLSSPLVIHAQEVPVFFCLFDVQLVLHLVRCVSLFQFLSIDQERQSYLIELPRNCLKLRFLCSLIAHLAWRRCSIKIVLTQIVFHHPLTQLQLVSEITLLQVHLLSALFVHLLRVDIIPEGLFVTYLVAPLVLLESWPQPKYASLITGSYGRLGKQKGDTCPTAIPFVFVGSQPKACR